MKKHIVVFTLAYFPLVGGAEIALREVAKRLKKNYRFTIITAQLSKKVQKRDTIDGIPVIRVGVGNTKLDKLLYPLLATKEAAKHKPDLVFALLENQAALAAQLYNQIHGTPIIINLQSGDSEPYIYKKLGIFSFLYNRVYNKKHHYAVLSRYLRQRALNHHIPAHNITIIPNGVDLELFNPARYSTAELDTLRKKLDLSGTVLITASRLTYKNAVDDIISALPLILKHTPATLIICGVGEDRDKLKTLAKQLGVDKHIRWVGLVPYTELPKYLLASDIFIRPSISEGFGNSFVEALAVGKPIIGTHVGGIPDFLFHEKTGLICKVRSPPDIALQVQRLTQNKELAQRIARAGQLMVREKYSWDTIALQFESLFKKVAP